MRKAITIICSISIIVCIVLIVLELVKERNHLEWEDEIANEFLLPEEEDTITIIDDEETPEEEPYVYETLGTERKSVNFPKLTQTNDDSVGWIYIPNTTINHPVVQGTDNEFYLYHNIRGQRSQHGSIYADYANAFLPMDTNVILHGHNMGQGRTTMFSQLVRYADAKFFQSHDRIQFDTKYGTGNWEVFAAYEFDLSADHNGFHYARVNFMNKNDFDDYIENARSRSLVYSGAEVNYGDKILTLSTCRYSGNDSRRFVVMAVLREGTLVTKKTVNNPINEVVEEEGAI